MGHSRCNGSVDRHGYHHVRTTARITTLISSTIETLQRRGDEQALPQFCPFVFWSDYSATGHATEFKILIVMSGC